VSAYVCARTVPYGHSAPLNSALLRGGIKLIHERKNLWRVQEIVAKPLSHLSPVLLLDMSIIVFFIGAASSKLNRPDPFGQIAKQVMT
jgi:hypothetical protein